jgi:hypothetical protein
MFRDKPAGVRRCQNKKRSPPRGQTEAVVLGTSSVGNDRQSRPQIRCRRRIRLSRQLRLALSKISLFRDRRSSNVANRHR